MSPTVNMDDHLDGKGRIDFNAYHRAKKANGDECYKCGQMVSIWGGKGYQQLCYDCTNAAKPEKVTHEKLLRCPRCGHMWDPYEGEDYGVFKEDGDDVYCPECDCEFHVSTSITYHFTSPPREESPPDGE